MSSQILEFPKSKIVRENLPENERVIQAKERSLNSFAAELSDDLAAQVYDELDNMGLDVDSEQFQKDYGFCVEALRASIYRAVGLDHRMHHFLDNNVRVIEEGQDIPEEV